MPQETPLLIPDEASRDEKRRQMRLKLERTLSPEKITAYVKAQLGDRNSMLASELLLRGGHIYQNDLHPPVRSEKKGRIPPGNEEYGGKGWISVPGFPDSEGAGEK